MFSSIGPWEIALILVAILILFGGRKIPQLARDLGHGIREFKGSLSGATQPEIEEEEPKAKTGTRKRTAASASGKSRRKRS